MRKSRLFACQTRAKPVLFNLEQTFSGNQGPKGKNKLWTLTHSKLRGSNIVQPTDNAMLFRNVRANKEMTL